MSNPIDDTYAAVPPASPAGKEDHDYLTQNIMSALERAVLARVDRRAAALGIGRRQAAVLVLREIAAG
jgi:hypothetical protein